VVLKPDTLALTALLAALTALGPLSTDMYLPSLPNIAGALQTTPAEVQWTLSVFLIGFAAGQVFHGPMADRYGRKPVLLAGLGLFFFATVACALAPTVEALVAARFFQALGASGPIVIARAIVRDLYEGPRAGQELARMGAIMGLVPAVAPVLGGVLEILAGWRSSFFVSAAFGLLAAGVVIQALPETLKTRLTTPFTLGGVMTGFASVGRHRGYRAHLAIVCATYGGLFAFISGSSFVLQGVYGVSEILFGVAFGACALSYVGGTLIGQRMVGRVGVARTIGRATALMALGGLMMLAFAAIPGGPAVEIVFPMMIYMVGVGVGLPQTQAAALMPFADRAGTASSLTGFAQMVFGAAVGLIIGATIGDSARPLAVMVALLGCSTWLVERWSRPWRMEDPVSGRP
jgi:DHA1 family bicyclomycin/chloramphenicol resistance-like MFS transporter